MGLEAKQEKDDKFQQKKKEVVEMIKTRAPSLESKVHMAESVLKVLCVFWMVKSDSFINDLWNWVVIILQVFNFYWIVWSTASVVSFLF